MTIDILNQLNLRPDMDVEQNLRDDLRQVEQLMLAQVSDFHPDLKIAAERLFASGGKRLRPKLILLIGRILEADPQSLFTLAASIEMLHTATLVHDDFIDGSILRRGIPTLNSRWSPAATVLTGDFLFASASLLAAKTNSIKVMNLFSRTLMTIVNGEVNQLLVHRQSVEVKHYFHRIYAKTASLFETATQSAAMISCSDLNQIEVLREFGYSLGMAFQIVDDILDYTANEQLLGKPVGGDLRQGLITLPILYYIQSNPNEFSVQKVINGQKIQNEDELMHLISKVNSSGAIQQTQKQAESFVSRAEMCLAQLPARPERDLLFEISRFINKRQH